MLASKVAAMMASLTADHVRALPPAARKRLANEALRLLKAATAPAPMPTAEGVLRRLKDGERAP
jgi:hypothetical protein